MDCVYLCDCTDFTEQDICFCFCESCQSSSHGCMYCDRPLVFEKFMYGSGSRPAACCTVRDTGEYESGHTGIFSRHYYLTGTDGEGKKIRVEISGQDYERLETAGSVSMEYYPNTKRVVKLLPV